MFTIKTKLTNAVFLFKLSSFNLAKLIGFKSRLCSDKRVLKHLPVSPIYPNNLHNEFYKLHNAYIFHLQSFILGKIFSIVLYG